MALSHTHPFDPETLYELDDNGNIQLTNGNRVGVFTNEGRHISGDIREADPQLCVWIANNPDPDGQLANSRMAGRDPK